MPLRLDKLLTKDPAEDSVRAQKCPYKNKINQIYVAVIILVLIHAPQFIEFYGIIAGSALFTGMLVAGGLIYFYMKGGG